MLRLIVVILAVTVALPAYSWEADTHYGLVKWLAVKAGFSLEDAELVAAGSEAPDESKVLSATAVVSTFICLGRSVEASHHVQQYHFPADGFVPGAQKLREVMPGHYGRDNSGNRWVRQEIAVPMPNADSRTRLNRFGYSLHPLGDSWSHQGVPDQPDKCPEKLIWSHPQDRGGWSSHDADLTYLHPDEVLQLAETTYRYMLDFLARNPDLRAGPPKPWPGLAGAVKAFADADKKDKKIAWFKGNRDVPLSSFTTYPCAIANISLPGRKPPCGGDDEAWWRRIVKDSGEKENSVPGNVNRFYDAFLNNWIIRQQVASVVKEHVEDEKVFLELGEAFSAMPKRDRQANLEALFGMWLIEDHGHVNRLGHGRPGAPGHKQLLLGENRDLQLIRQETLAQAIRAPFGSGPYEIVPVSKDGERGRYAAVFSFRHAPRDTVVVISDMIGDSRKVTELYWVAL